MWRALGTLSPRYLEPFAGSLAVLLGRPRLPVRPREVVNDSDGLVANWWRGVRLRPDETAEAMEWPPIELEVKARGEFCRRADDEGSLTERLRAEPSWCDPVLAGWWAWTMRSAAIPPGSGSSSMLNTRTVYDTDPREVCRSLADRLRFVNVTCGSWSRIVSEGNISGGSTAIFLDPPYDNAVRSSGLYRDDDGSVAADVAQWCVDHGDRPNLRIVLAGYSAEHDDRMPESWSRIEWGTAGVFGGDSIERGRSEVLWLSPGCRPVRMTA